MRKLLIIVPLFVMTFPLFANRVEIIEDFLPNGNDQSIFILPEGWSDPKLPFFCHIKQALAEKKLAIRHTDFSEYKPLLGKRKKNTLMKRCKRWLGLDSISLDKEVEYFIFFNLRRGLAKFDLDKLPKEKMIFFIWEPPTVYRKLYSKRIQALFSKIYTWDDDLVDNKKYFKFYYPCLQKMREKIPGFEERKLCTLISSDRHSRHKDELYSQREATIQFFENDDNADFEFYGRGWEVKGYKNYRGCIPDKYEVLQNYRFCICYENMQRVKGYITEKIFDCFAVGCVPVYWGASNIEDYIPANCFIDRRKFTSHQELYDFMKNITKEEYDCYIKNIQQWLESEQAQRFSQTQFVKIFTEAVSSESLN